MGVFRVITKVMHRVFNMVKGEISKENRTLRRTMLNFSAETVQMTFIWGPFSAVGMDPMR